MAIVAADHVDLGRDAALVERTQAGEREAFEDLYRRYFPRLRRFCMRYLHDPADAEEVAQEALARAYRSIATLNGDRRFYPWLSVIAKRLCIDHIRRQSRISLASEFDDDEMNMAGPDEHLVDLADQQLVRSALGTLTPRHREVLERREVDGWSYQRIADAYGVSLGTVEQLLMRARKSLRKSFLELDGESIGAAAGVPVLGWVASRWTRVRVAFHARASRFEEILTPLSARAAGLAIVVGAAGMGGGAGVAHAAAVAPHHRDAVVAAASQSSSATAINAASAAAHATSAHGGGTGMHVDRGGPNNVGPRGPSDIHANPGIEFQVHHQPAWIRVPVDVYLPHSLSDVTDSLFASISRRPR